MSVSRILLIALLAAPVAARVYPAHADVLPTLRSTTPKLSVRDDGRLDDFGWFIYGVGIPAVYEARRSDHPRVVMVYSDVDTLTIRVEPGNQYDFVVALGDSGVIPCRVSTRLRSPRRVGPGVPLGPVAIPFELRDGGMFVKGSINGSAPLELVFDTGGLSAIVHRSALKKGVAGDFPHTMPVHAIAADTTLPAAFDAMIEIGGLRWENEDLLFLDTEVERQDGVVGSTLFEDRVVELDFERKVIVVHESLEPRPEGFAALPMGGWGVQPRIEASFVIDDAAFATRVFFDTGSSSALFVNDAFADMFKIRESLRPAGTAISTDALGTSFPHEQAILPALRIAGTELRNVPIEVAAASEDEPDFSRVLLGLEVISRYHTFLDYRNQMAYLKPNTKFDEPFAIHPLGAFFEPPSAAFMWITAVVSLALTGAAVWIASKMRTGPRDPA